MTKQEHELMVLMFARLNESIGVIVETLRSNGIWTGDDSKAFSHAVHADEQKVLFYVSQARRDYFEFAKLSGVTLQKV
jgi:hypothetical protein